jgi:hypothetical protein
VTAALAGPRRAYHTEVDRSHDMRAPAVDSLPAREHHRDISPKERGEPIAERDRQQAEFMSDRLPGDRHVNPIEVCNGIEPKQPEKYQYRRRVVFIDALLLFSARKNDRVIFAGLSE